MAKTYSRRPQRRHPIEFKRQIAEAYLSGDYSLNSLAKRYDVSRVSIRYWATQYQRGEFDDITPQMVADLISKNKKLESLVVRQSIEIDELRGRVAALAF